MNHETATVEAAAQATVSAPEAHRVEKPIPACGNCGAPMHGPFCYACGQPEKGMIRHLASVMADVADTIFNVDSRVFRTLPPLYFRPGFLTNEYFAGRRTRYVTPFRLFFFLCVISFFAIQATLNFDDMHLHLGGDNGHIDSAKTPADAEKARDEQIAALTEAKDAASRSAKAQAKIGQKIEDIRSKADKRIAFLKARDEAVAHGGVAPPDPADYDENDIISFNDKEWNAVKNPVHVDWLPDFANAKLNAMIGRARDNLMAARRDQGHLVAALFSVLPQTLFVLMPLFAFLLKVAYIFKRRLYMEHLMVALHSHAFICMSLLIAVVLHLLIGWTDVHATWASPLLQLVKVAVWTWLPIYLFLMAKRVYRQGWFMTTFKFCLVGFCYIVLLSFGLVGALIASLTIA
jgi:hypothetical protein